MICEFCGKRFKQETAFKKHHCKQMDKFCRFDEGAFDLYVAWLKAANLYKASERVSMRMNFAKSRYFDDFLLLKNFQNQCGMKADTAYAEYLAENRIPKQDWRKKKTLNSFIVYRAHNENYALSVERSINYLASRNLAFETCPVYSLYQFLKDGLISKNLFLSKNVDVSTVFPKDWLENLKEVL